MTRSASLFGKLKNMAFDFAGIARSLKGLEERLAFLREESAKLQQQRTRIQHAPAARSDVKEMLARWVNDSANGFTGSLALQIEEFVRRPERMQGNLLVNARVSLVGAPVAARDSDAVPQVDRALCALLAPQIKQALAAMVDGMAWPEGGEGLPAAKRAAEISALDLQIEKLESEIASLTDQASAAGIRI
jgi:hypothetical protein